ncbi:MAG TPA: hypothetical protein EYO21_08970 [Candidatus Marinimicrobia bacterium]|nr:hypothetical protein [Candidatus Neomarinimicrobiota bacterium]HIO35914.1 hypothetical protein [Candidatus Neomarinimicrobiota bacterium]HIO90062.1 hypothetical protein [Candidatus Neomarinimicrobiota bacterium]
MMTPHFKYIFPLIIGLAIAQILTGQTTALLIGWVTGPDGRGIPYANVYLKDGEAGTTSDREGRFILQTDGEESRKLLISHSAFQPVEISIQEMNRLGGEITMEIKTYRFDPVVVYGNLYNRESLQLPVSHRAVELQKYPASGNSIGEKLDRLGIQVRDYGGPAGLKTVSSPTGYSEHILVMLDGFPLNSPQNGIVDFSTLPAEFFSHAEFYPGQASSLYGSHAVGGTLNLLPAAGRNFLKFRVGSLGEQGTSGESTFRVGEMSASLHGNRFESEGNYRENNQFAQDAVVVKLTLPAVGGWSVNSYLLASLTERGIPGSVQYPSPSAYKNNEDMLLLVSGRTVSRWGYSEVYAGSFQSDEHYTNPDWAVDSQHKTANNRLRLIHRSQPDQNFTNTVSLEVAQVDVKSNDAGKHVMATGAAGLLSQIRVGSQLTISPSVRLDWDDHSDNKIATGNLALLWSPEESMVQSVAVSGGTSYRNPTFNDLFWEDAMGYSKGNPDLIPERGMSSNMKVDLRPILENQLQFSAGVSYFITDNLIQWAPDDAWVYSPQNILKSESSVMRMSAQFLPNSLPVVIRLGTESTESQILSEGNDKGKSLLYVPPTSLWAEVELKLGGLAANLNVRSLGERRYSYGEGELLRPYERMDGALNYSFSVSQFNVNLEGGVRNMLDTKDLQSVYDYPEPGRTIFMAVGLEL